MADLKVIKQVASLSPPDIIEFVLTFLQFCKQTHVTSIGLCACYSEDEKDWVYVDHLSTDPADQDNFEHAALELRHSIIDALDDWQIDLYEDE